MRLFEQFKEIFIYNTLKRKVFSFILVVLVSFLSGFLYTFYMTSKINDQINTMFTNSISLNEMTTTMTGFELTLENYLSTKSSDSFVQYLNLYDELELIQEDISFGKSNDASLLQLNDISLILTHYLDKAEEAIEFKRARNTEKYLEAYAIVLEDSSYIHEKVKRMETNEFKTNLNSYLLLTERMKNVRINLLMIIGLLVALSFTFVYSFSMNVTQPIEELSERADAISRGQYTIKKLYGYHFREAEVLKTAFVDMAYNINQYIKELEDKVETENKLRISETEKLRIQNLLNQAELMALQSQINPHFLFNTLNAGMQLANIEDAERTAAFLDYTGRLFRYNIQSMDNHVCLKDEIQNAMNYYELMKVRFADQLVMTFNIDKAVNDFPMPPLILQPLVENALIHGFEQKFDVGRIDIYAQLIGDKVVIEINDNGQGIVPDKLAKLKAREFEQSRESVGHTTGLGIGNVYERLNHFYHATDVMDFESEFGHYTKVILMLPYEERDDV